MAPRQSPAQAKARKQRMILIGLGVLLLIVGVIQVPKLLKHKPAAEAVPVSTTTSSSTDTTAAPATAAPTTPVAVVPTGPTGLAGGQLANLSRFAIKDPFHAQVKTGGTGVASAAASSSPAPAKAPANGAVAPPTSTTTPTPAVKPAKKQPPAASKPTPVAPSAPTTTVNFTSKPVPPNAAVIKMNGRQQVVPIGEGFPSEEPLFKLVKLGKKDVRIGVVGGSFASGVPTLDLATGKKIILANAADGSRYELLLVRLTNAAPTQQPVGSVAPAAPGAVTTVPSQPATSTAVSTTSTAVSTTPTPPATATTPATTIPATTTPASTTGGGTTSKTSSG